MIRCASRQMKLEGVSKQNWRESANKTFISDRHRGIAKWVRENQKETCHVYDVWHVARSLTKKLLKAAKEKGCEVIKDWIKGIRRHMYWCATSTVSGFGALIKAKWNSFLRHVADKHSEHPDPLFKTCKHDSLQPRTWIKIGDHYFFAMYYPLSRKWVQYVLRVEQYLKVPMQRNFRYSDYNSI